MPSASLACTLLEYDGLHAAMSLVVHAGAGPSALRPMYCALFLVMQTKLESKGVVVGVEVGDVDAVLVADVLGEVVRVEVSVVLGVDDAVDVPVVVVVAVVVKLVVRDVVGVLVGDVDVVAVVVGDVARQRNVGLVRNASAILLSVFTVPAQFWSSTRYLVNPHFMVALAPTGPRNSWSSVLSAAAAASQPPSSTTSAVKPDLSSHLTGLRALPAHLLRAPFSTLAWVAQLRPRSTMMLLAAPPAHWKAPT